MRATTSWSGLFLATLVATLALYLSAKTSGVHHSVNQPIVYAWRHACGADFEFWHCLCQRRYGSFHGRKFDNR